MMMRVAIIGTDGKIVSPMDLTKASDLRDAATLARTLVADCERLAAMKEPKVSTNPQPGMPYTT
jgi:hypothetical protein